MIKSLLYPLIGSALVTIAPFLLTFEKGQDIVRGLFGFEIFTLLLFFVYFRDGFVQGKSSSRNLKKNLNITGMVISIGAMIVVAWLDLQNLLAIKGWETGLYGILPFVTVTLAVLMQMPVKKLSIHSISLVVFVTFFAHLVLQNFYYEQPFAVFPVVDYMDQNAPRPVERKILSEDFAAKYNVTDSVSITKHFVDTTRSNVVILVESWGIPMDSILFRKELNVFDGNVHAQGIHFRMYSRTRTAEREDLLKFMSKDTVGRKDSLFLPQAFAEMGYRTSFLFGGDSLEQWRYKYLRNMGFRHLHFGGDESDKGVVAVIDSMLNAATQDSSRYFLAWTTRDTRFPMVGNADQVDSTYRSRLMETLELIAELGRKHPEVRFVVQGDHEPILSPIAFQRRFYKRWVPYVVLN